MEYSRNPEDYRPDPTGHLRRRIDERKIPPKILGDSIREGEVLRECPDDGRVEFGWSIVNIDYKIVVDVEDNYVITAYEIDGNQN